jgi:hypothetical protein
MRWDDPVPIFRRQPEARMALEVMQMLRYLLQVDTNGIGKFTRDNRGLFRDVDFW